MKKRITLSLCSTDLIDDYASLWDAGFGVASALLAMFFGVALGNVVRGVPLDASGYFFLPLWTDFGISGELGILDWYTVTTGLAAFMILVLHGALWVALKTDGPVEQRCRSLAIRAWWPTGALIVLITVLSFRVQPQLAASFSERPWGYAIPAAALTAFVLIRVWAQCHPAAAFLTSSIFIAGMLSSAAFGLYPYVLPSRIDPQFGLTVTNAAATAYGLKVGLAWWIPGIALAIAYVVFVYRHFAGKVRLPEEGY